MEHPPTVSVAAIVRRKEARQTFPATSQYLAKVSIMKHSTEQFTDSSCVMSSGLPYNIPPPLQREIRTWVHPAPQNSPLPPPGHGLECVACTGFSLLEDLSIFFFLNQSPAYAFNRD